MKYIIGNWKMFPRTLKEAQTIIKGVKHIAMNTKRTKVVVCPPSVYLGALVTKGKMQFGAQDSHEYDDGAYTGETGATAIRSVGATHVILGHSERRAMGEGSERVAQKVANAVRNSLTVVLCVGEKMRDDDGAYFGEVREQLLASLKNFPKAQVKRLIIAYEPIWAIGNKAVRPATPEDLHEMVILIRKTLVQFFGKQQGFTIPILYGGSVDEKNAESFLTKGTADGLLVGRVSLDVKKFNAIVAIADTLKK